jgi:hypothetical protein
MRTKQNRLWSSFGDRSQEKNNEGKWLKMHVLSLEKNKKIKRLKKCGAGCKFWVYFKQITEMPSERKIPLTFCDTGEPLTKNVAGVSRPEGEGDYLSFEKGYKLITNLLLSNVSSGGGCAIKGIRCLPRF